MDKRQIPMKYYYTEEPAYNFKCNPVERVLKSAGYKKFCPSERYFESITCRDAAPVKQEKIYDSKRLTTKQKKI